MTQTFEWVGLDHIQLAAPPGAEEEARRFFTGLLGMPEVPKPEKLRARGGAWFRCGAQLIHLGIEQGFIPAKKAHPAFVVQNIEALIAHLEKAGVPLRLDDEIPGLIRFFTEDPFGNRLEFMEAK
ncbi:MULTISPECIES: VOC family protein [Brevibacillus]|jgi:catechol 2,3-dioxygenase-like lactoylglutathione lyase family enzyme|uniref:Glyoxalase n=1 Tax=Brevibacillus parabrevis TaxID=54914 RepID=A0A4Y3PFY0_BREPA|nr:MULTISPECIES: VOC family protein [Brevibacillus]TGV29862.1 glyoxalase [Mesorhizobium sp. M00.F.Ca.ET.186.01.1.1]MBU8712045.1 VOC family protein [Brevibacillus parabrevis]MDH6349112.1 catechol 2,3-dioxygenase-like lactoylglutathione lyase family enzyme [Brevibacillus sp. 1238]MDR5001128.1 VOC family protein [Brevibacillus parabrevis]MED1724103.1 VOC family protein [Brevibacillus parabrevis]